jgi:hypothetical protein
MTTVYLDLSNQPRQGCVKRIVNCTRQRTPKKPSMVILNTDYNYGTYVKDLSRLFKSLGMIEQAAQFREMAINHINTGDFIVVGEDNPYNPFDFRVVSDQQEVEDLDGRSFKVYDLINDWSSILNKLSQYSKFTTNRSIYGGIIPQYEQEVQEQRFQRPSILDLTVEDTCSFQMPQREQKVDYTAIYRPVAQKEKITIFDNWVKIGMRSFDVHYNMFGQELVQVDGKNLYVKNDRIGRKYLAIR